MMKILIKHGRVIDPANDIDETLDLLVADGKIARIARKIEANQVEEIDASRCVVRRAGI